MNESKEDEYKQQITFYCQQLEMLTQKEHQIKIETKKKSDLARQMMIEKDQEINLCKEKINSLSQSLKEALANPVPPSLIHPTVHRDTAKHLSTSDHPTPSTRNTDDSQSTPPIHTPLRAIPEEHQVDLTLATPMISANLQQTRFSPVNSNHNSGNNTLVITNISESRLEREQKLVYLKQAFCGLFKAKQPIEMQHLGRVICAILDVSTEEQNQIMDSIAKLSPAVVTSTTIESLSQSIASIFL